MTFHLSEDGGPQIVSSFKEHKGATANETKLPPMPANAFNNFPTAAPKGKPRGRHARKTPVTSIG